MGVLRWRHDLRSEASQQQQQRSGNAERNSHNPHTLPKLLSQVNASYELRVVDFSGKVQISADRSSFVTSIQIESLLLKYRIFRERIRKIKHPDNLVEIENNVISDLREPPFTRISIERIFTAGRKLESRKSRLAI